MLSQWVEERAHFGRKGMPPCASFVSRLTLTQMLSGHTGCVNTLHWSPDQKLLISGSDDRRVLLWSIGPERSKCVHDVATEHRHNIFDARLNAEQTHLATCGADGLVTVVEGVCAGVPHASRIFFDTRQTTMRRSMANKLLWIDNNVFFTSFGDGSIRQIDVRIAPDKIDKVFASFQGATRPMELCPFDNTKLAVGGGDIYIRVIDRRYVYANTQEDNLVARFSHPRLEGADKGPRFSNNSGISDTYISSLEWGPNGQLLANFRCEDMVVFDGYKAIQEGFHGLSTEYVVQTYTGRENVQTIAKEARFIFGGNYILSGGDCGGIYIWDVKHSEPVRRLHADRCCVNCVLPHGSLPYILSSGIDDEIKMWDISTERKPLTKITSHPNPAGGFTERMNDGPGNLMDGQARLQLTKCAELKVLGNGFVKAGKYDDALEKYSEALRVVHFVSHNEDIEARQKYLSSVLCTNQALCYYQLKSYASAIECCDKVLVENAKHPKALFRKAQSYVALNELQNAQEILKLVEGGDAAVIKLQREIDHRIKAQYELEKRQCRRMFG